MKTMKFWFVMAVAVIMTSMAFVSCSEDDPIIPEVIESEVLESGLDEEVVSSTSDDAGASGTTLSYQSWILVKGQTRANFENKVTVTLNNRFNNVVEEKEVSNFNFGNPTISTEIRKADSRVEQNYVTVTDSVLVYRLTYENDFSFEYELLYQVPEYNDGVTKQMMPYYSIGQIVDNGVKLSGMDALEENGITYQRKLCQHSITVTFNGKKYDVGASIVLRSQAREDYLVSSKVVNEGVELISVDLNLGGKSKSWIEVEQEWSESGKKNVKIEYELSHSVEGSKQEHYLRTIGKWDDFTDIAFDMQRDSCVVSTKKDGDITITQHSISGNLAISERENRKLLANISAHFNYETAVYNDGVLSYEMPSLKFSECNYEVNSHDFLWEEFGSEYRLLLTTEITSYFGEPNYEAFGTDEDGDGIDDVTGEEIVISCTNMYSYKNSVTLVYEP